MKIKISAMFIALISIFSLSMSASASGITENVVVTENTRVSEGDLNILGLGRPTNTHNLITSGQMDFGGVAGSSELYTNSYFTGKGTFEFKITNNISKDLKIRFYEKGTFNFPELELIIDGNSTYQATITGFSSSKSYYIQFLPSSDFKGWIR